MSCKSGAVNLLRVVAAALAGEQDRVATPGKVSAVASLLLHAQRAVVPACGHLSHEEAPQKLLELMVPFCQDRLAPRPTSGTAVRAPQAQ